MIRPLRLLTAGLILASASPAFAEVQVSGLADIVFQRKPKTDFSNETFRNFSNFHTIRTRLFVDAELDDKVNVFTQVLFDNGNLSLYGAYARFSNLFGRNLHAHLGLIPLPVGTFGPRTYSDKNPLIGIPLLYNYHTILNPKGASSSGYGAGGVQPQRTVAELIAARDNRDNASLPVLYDNCWNTGLEILGGFGSVDYSLALLTGSVSHPTVSQSKNLPQLTSRLGYNFSPGLVVGGSGYFGPYLSEDYLADTIPTGAKYNDYINAGVGVDLYFLPHRLLELYAEGFWSSWEHPWLPTLKTLSGYAEAQLTFSPGWYLAGRADILEPLKVEDGFGGKVAWDYPVQRWEFGLGYKPTRAVVLKAVTQLNYIRGSDTLDHNLYALQTSISF